MFYSCAFNESISYPYDYNNISDNFKIKTLNHLSWLSDSYFSAEKRMYDEYLTESTRKTYKKVANEYMNKINGIVQYLEYIDIYVAYDWPGHRREWFFVTEYESERYSDWLHQCAD